MQKSRMKSGKRKKNSYASFKINSEIPFLNSAILYTEYTFFLVFKNTTHITVTYQRMHYPAKRTTMRAYETKTHPNIWVIVLVKIRGKKIE